MTSEAEGANRPTSGRRRYRMRKRREDMEATRRRIVEAAVELHGSVGPRHTTFAGVAARAGVQRSTLYRHFPDEAALTTACTTHWMAQHPPPDPAGWAAIEDPGERLEHGLTELYRFFAENREMLANSFRDLDVLPPFVVESMAAAFDAMHAVLLDPWPADVRRAREFQAVLRHAIDFGAWQSLAAGLEPGEAARVMARMVGALACERR